MIDECYYIEILCEDKEKTLVRKEIINKSDFPNINSSGFWGRQKSNILMYWVDMAIFRNHYKKSIHYNKLKNWIISDEEEKNMNRIETIEKMLNYEERESKG